MERFFNLPIGFKATIDIDGIDFNSIFNNLMIATKTMDDGLSHSEEQFNLLSLIDDRMISQMMHGGIRTSMGEVIRPWL